MARLWPPSLSDAIRDGPCGLKAELPAPPGAAPGRAEKVSAGELALVLGRSAQSGANASLGSSAPRPDPGELGGRGTRRLHSIGRSLVSAIVGRCGHQHAGRDHRDCDLGALAHRRLAIPVATVKRVTGQLLERALCHAASWALGAVRPASLSCKKNSRFRIKAA